MHPARAARVAILHQWTNTQTEGWWRQAFDVYSIPYDYIDPQTIRDTADLRGEVRRDHLRPRRRPGRGRRDADVAERRFRTSNTAGHAERRHLGADRRHAHRHGARRADAPAASSSTRAACSSASNSSADFAITQQLHLRRQREPPGRDDSRVVGSLLRTKLVDDTSPVVYGVPDNLAVYSDGGETLQRQRDVGGGGRGGGGGGGGAAGGGRGGGPAADARPAAARPTIRTSCRAVRRDEGTNLTPLPPPRAGAAVAVRAADRRGAEAESRPT